MRSTPSSPPPPPPIKHSNQDCVKGILIGSRDLELWSTVPALLYLRILLKRPNKHAKAKEVYAKCPVGRFERRAPALGDEYLRWLSKLGTD